MNSISSVVWHSGDSLRGILYGIVRKKKKIHKNISYGYLLESG